MKVGAQLLLQNEFGREHDFQAIQNDLRLIGLAEPLGFDSVWTVEHHFTGYSLSPNALASLAYIAGQTKRVELGTQDSALLEDLRREFPEAHSIERDDAALGRFVTELLHRIDGAAPREDLPLDIQATAFQRRVYEELLRIPTGETRSYAEIAEAIGQPTASRAVGNACATNPVALAIPCHRVLRNNGTLGGYAWGIERKQALISAERRTARRAG